MKRVLFFIFLLLLIFPIRVNGKTISIKTSGIAISIPGEFGKQFFYLSDGKNLWQIYSYHSNFPPVKKGDILIVNGEKSETRGMARIKILEKNQIKIIKNAELPKTIEIEIGAAKENLGKIVSLEGEIKKDENDNFYFFKQKEKIFLISPKASKSFIKEVKNVTLIGVPIVSGKDISFLLLSQTTKKENFPSSTNPQINQDLLRPEKEYHLIKNILFFVVIFSLILLIFKIIKKRRKL